MSKIERLYELTLTLFLFIWSYCTLTNRISEWINVMIAKRAKMVYELKPFYTKNIDDNGGAKTTIMSCLFDQELLS